MKKFISWVLTIVMLLGAIALPAYAEDFSLHSDVTFNMTVDEMLEKETAAGYSPEAVNDIVVTGLTDGWTTFDLSSYSAIYKIDGSFVGGASKSLYYFFDKDGNLCQMLYTCPGLVKASALASVTSLIDSLAELVTEKYSDPYDGDILEIQNTYDFRDLINSSRTSNSSRGVHAKALTDGSYQWFVPCGEDNTVEIEAMPIQWYAANNATKNMPVPVGYGFLLGYTRVVTKEYEAACAEIEQQAQQEAEQKQQDAANLMDDI